jgi:hypothetical protein
VDEHMEFLGPSLSQLQLLQRVIYSIDTALCSWCLQKRAQAKKTSRPHTMFATGPAQAPQPGLALDAAPMAAMGPTGFAAGAAMPPPPMMPMMGVPGAGAGVSRAGGSPCSAGSRLCCRELQESCSC